MKKRKNTKKEESGLIERIMIDTESELFEMDDKELFRGLYGKDWIDEVYKGAVSEEELERMKKEEEEEIKRMEEGGR